LRRKKVKRCRLFESTKEGAGGKREKIEQNQEVDVALATLLGGEEKGP